MTTPEIVRHVLLGRFRPAATRDQIQSFADEFRAMAVKIDGVVSFEYGANHSPEGLNRDFTHVFIVTFNSPQARDAYLPHPGHQAFVAWVGQLGIVEELLVVDYSPRT